MDDAPAMHEDAATMHEHAIPSPSPIDASVGRPRILHDRTVLRVVLGVLVVAAAAMLVPFWPWLTLAAWLAALAAPAMRRLTRSLGNRRRAAGLLLVSLFVLLVTPLALVVASVWSDATELLHTVRGARSPAHALSLIVTGHGHGALSHAPRALTEMIRAHADETLDDLVGGALLSAADLSLGFFVLFSAAYVFATEGERMLGWVEENTPLPARHVERLAAAFQETGRGLLVGVGLTGLVQAVIATIAYAALGVPRALVLGLLTLIASLVPSVGTALVWVPVTIGLALAGQRTEAIVLAVVGVAFISVVDNVLRPVLCRWGKLELHGLVVLLSMLGGLALLGGWGLLLGPLVVRLALEGLRIAKEEKAL